MAEDHHGLLRQPPVKKMRHGDLTGYQWAEAHGDAVRGEALVRRRISNVQVSP